VTDLDRARLDRVLPAAAGSPDWDDVLGRAGVRERRQRIVVVAAVALVAVVATASALAVRTFVLDRGFIGLPPVGAAPSAQGSGTVVLHFYGRSHTFGGRLSRVWVYADGRMIWDREGPVLMGANEHVSGLIEERLTPEGVELLRSEIVATGLFGRDHAFLTNAPGSSSPTMVQRASVWGAIQVREDDRLVRLTWENPDIDPDKDEGTIGTSEELGLLERVDALVTDPASWLPASAWAQRKTRAYVASRYAVCWGHRPELPWDERPPTIETSRILGLLPAPAEDLLRRGSIGADPNVDWPPAACSVVPTEEARRVARALDDGALERLGSGESGRESLYRLAYRFEPPDPHPGWIYVYFEPVLPHGEWMCSACG
jgi:hypothetical protein